MRRVTCLLVVLALAGGAVVAPTPLGPAPSVAAQESPAPSADVQPIPLLTARPSGAGWQYSLTVALPAEGSLGELRVELALPAGGEVVEALEARPELLWLGVEGGRAVWKAAAPPNSFVGPFGVTVRGGRGPATEARVAWSGPPAGELRVRLAAELAPPGPAASLSLAAQSSSTLQVLGDSGLLAAVPTAAAGTPGTWSVRAVSRESDPPPSVAPASWWVATVEAAGPGLLAAPVVLLVPARQPVPPGAEVRVYRESDRGWRETATRGVVSPDGLQVAVPVDVPGLYAAALSGLFRLQPAPLDGGPAATLTVPRQANHRCDAFGSCLVAGEPAVAHVCTVDRAICVEQDGGPPLVTRVCTPVDASRACASQAATLPGAVGSAPR